MRRKILIGTAVAALGLGACSGYGSDDDAGSEGALIDSTRTEDQSGDQDNGWQSPDEPQGSEILGFETTEIGDVLTDSEGFTLYGLTDDSKTESTCYDECAETWPPLLVDSSELPGGLDPNRFSVIQRDDGTYQLVAGNYPLYRFADDEQPGDTNGQGVGGVWFAMHPSGVLLVDGADTDVDRSDDMDDMDEQMEDMKDEMEEEMGNDSDYEDESDYSDHDEDESGYDYGS